MMPIPIQSPAASASAPPGVVRVIGRTADFTALLPGLVAPVMPRQRDAEGGKDLPAAPLEEDGGAEDIVAAWVTPPLWPAVCPPVAGEVAAAVPGTAPMVAPPPVAPLALAATPLADVPASNPIAATPLADAPAPSIVAPPVAPLPFASAAPLSAAAALSGGGARLAPIGTMADPGVDRRSADVISPPLAIPASPGGASASTSLAASQLTAVSRNGGASDGLAIAPQTPSPVTSLTRSAKDAPAAAINAAAPAAPIVVTPQADLRPLQPARVAPAAEMFAAAIQRAARDERRPEASDAAAGMVAPTTDLATHAVTAADASRHAALDMARETWPARMIERIELLRDAADAVDTSIRMMPDKLGAIDVSLRRDGDTVQVQFTAQQAETRQLLADAQPKLVELADAKGLRLAMQAGGDGAGSQPQQQQRATAPAPSITPPRASSEDDGIAADERIA